MMSSAAEPHAVPVSVPNFLLPETVASQDGEGPALELGAARGRRLKLTLGITRILEQQSLDVSIWGSADGAEWGARPLAAFPQSFYCGTATLALDLSGSPDVAQLKVRYRIARWGRGAHKPAFGFYVFAAAE
jgi:hypothetical protein